MALPAAMRAAAKVAKETAALDEVVEVGGRSMSKRDLIKFEIEKMLRSNGSQADVTKSLKSQGITFDNEWIKNQIAVAKRRDMTLKPDPRQRKMEANWVIEKGLGEGKTWEQIGVDLQDAGFKKGGEMALHAKSMYYKRLMSKPEPAVIDNGESGPNAGPQDGDYRMPQKLTDEELMGALKAAAEEASKRAKNQTRAARERGAASINSFDWSGLDELAKMWSDPGYKNPELIDPKMSGSLPDGPARPSDMDVITAERMPKTEEEMSATFPRGFNYDTASPEDQKRWRETAAEADRRNKQ